MILHHYNESYYYLLNTDNAQMFNVFMPDNTIFKEYGFKVGQKMLRLNFIVNICGLSSGDLRKKGPKWTIYKCNVGILSV